MPITSMSTITPLSKQWTHKNIVSEAMVLTGTLDNETVQLDNIRNHLNASLSYIANLLNLAERPWYGIWMKGTIETAIHALGVDSLDLSTAIDTVIPANYLASIKRVGFMGSTKDGYVGNAAKWDMAVLLEQASNLNDQMRHTLAWTWNGSDILIYAGNEITSLRTPSPDTISYTIVGQNITIAGYRKPLLDNLIAPNQQTGSPIGNYESMIDLPDEHVELLLNLIMKKIYTQRRERAPESLEQDINQGVAQISGLINQEMQFEAAERDKVRYGSPQKTPGAM